MDNTQLLLSAAIVITTIIIVFVGIQLIAVLRTIRKLIIKTDDILDENDNISLKSKKVNKKKAGAIFSILNKISSLSSPYEKTKRYFIKESKSSGEVEKHR
jgi:hypothetical protein